MIFRCDSGDTALVDSAAGLRRTYRELGADVCNTAEALERNTKSLIFCFCRNDYDSLRGYLAGLQAGHAAALLDDGLAQIHRSSLIARYEPDFLIHSRAAAGPYADSDYELFESSGPHIWRRKRPAEGGIHSDLTLLLSTSGSTGTPKFVRLTSDNLLANARSIIAGLNIRPRDRAITSLPFHYSYGLSVVNTHLLSGASLALTNESITSRPFWAVLKESCCTSLAGVPYSYQILKRLGFPGDDFPHLKTLTQAGGKLRTDLVSEFETSMRSRKGRFYVMYGQTEATARIAILDPELLPEKLGAAGRVIRDGSIQICSHGESEHAGEIVYSGPNVMLGYATSRADLSKGDELRSTLHTGDLGYLDSDGCVFITGRLNRYAKLSGLRLNLDELESLLKGYGPSAVVGLEDRLVIFCEGQQPVSLLQRQREFSKCLSVHHRLLDIRSIPQLPLKNNGKIDYRLLEEAARC